MTFPSTKYSPDLTSLVEECPVAIEVNDISYAVMLCSPYDLEAFVIGFLITEQIVQFNHDIHDIHIEPFCTSSREIESIVVNVKIANRCLINLKDKQRQVLGASGCGVCGKVALEQVFPKGVHNTSNIAMGSNSDIRASSRWYISNRSRIRELRDELGKHQVVAKQSGALHAAFWLDENANITLCLEDIGRHNALDKLIGQLLISGINPNTGAVLITSRCSAELIQKSAIAHITTLISLASPSQLAVSLANKHHLQLIHLPKYDAPIVYTSLANVHGENDAAKS